MNDDGFSIPVSQVMATMSALLRHQGLHDLDEVFGSASARIEETGYDNWNGGTYFYTLSLHVPISLFARLQANLPEIEATIGSKLAATFRHNERERLNAASIQPALQEGDDQSTVAAPALVDSERLWGKGRVRLFLSHIAVHKVQVTGLKSALHDLGVSGFVAHEDIEPNLLWQGEIEIALASMDAMAALLTPGFHESSWTDQEIGAALGRNVPVVPVSLGVGPYGFIAKFQAIRGQLSEPEGLAAALVGVLLRDRRTTSLMRAGLVVALEEAWSYSAANAVAQQVETSSGFTMAQVTRMEDALADNSQVRDAYVASGKLAAVLPRLRAASEERLS